MVTLISESPLYFLSSEQFPESRVISVICHPRLERGLQPAALAQVGPMQPVCLAVVILTPNDQIK